MELILQKTHLMCFTTKVCIVINFLQSMDCYGKHQSFPSELKQPEYCCATVNIC